MMLYFFEYYFSSLLYHFDFILLVLGHLMTCELLGDGHVLYHDHLILFGSAILLKNGERSF